jgi:hypothetical protein
MASVSEAAEVVTAAPYGRACVACSRAKVRCLYRKDEAVCERQVLTYLPSILL